LIAQLWFAPEGIDAFDLDDQGSVHDDITAKPGFDGGALVDD